jgi:adenosylcobinamide-GDP ribazoletransferase
MHPLRRFWQGWTSALRFLTILPLPGGTTQPFDPRLMMAMFPLCGLCIGLIAAAIDMAAAFLWIRPAASFLVVLALAAITGALHLDGVADTADGLYGLRDRQRALEIMKDSRIGAMGTVALICCVVLKWTGVWGIDSYRAFWIVLVPAYARAAVLFGVRGLPYGRPDGTGHGFFKEPLRWTDFWGVMLIVVLSLAAGQRMVVINLGFAAIVAATIAYYRRKMNCITGDMLGAMIEITEAGLFLLVSATAGA